MGTIARTVLLVCLIALVAVSILRWALRFVPKQETTKAIEELPEKSSKEVLPPAQSPKKLPAPPSQEVIEAEVVEDEPAPCENLSAVDGLVEEIQKDFGALINKATGDESPASEWESKDRLEFLEAKHGALPSFIKDRFDKNSE